MRNLGRDFLEKVGLSLGWGKCWCSVKEKERVKGNILSKTLKAQKLVIKRRRIKGECSDGASKVTGARDPNGKKVTVRRSRHLGATSYQRYRLGMGTPFSVNLSGLFWRGKDCSFKFLTHFESKFCCKSQWQNSCSLVYWRTSCVLLNQWHWSPSPRKRLLSGGLVREMCEPWGYRTSKGLVILTTRQPSF